MNRVIRVLTRSGAQFQLHAQNGRICPMRQIGPETPLSTQVFPFNDGLVLVDPDFLGTYSSRDSNVIRHPRLPWVDGLQPRAQCETPKYGVAALHKPNDRKAKLFIDFPLDHGITGFKLHCFALETILRFHSLKSVRHLGPLSWEGLVDHPAAARTTEVDMPNIAPTSQNTLAIFRDADGNPVPVQLFPKKKHYASVQVGNFVCWMIGGSVDGLAKSSVTRATLLPGHNRVIWQQHTPLNRARRGAHAVYDPHTDCVFVIGGRTSMDNLECSMEVWLPEENNWQLVSLAPELALDALEDVACVDMLPSAL
jgi:hypothetical protein